MLVERHGYVANEACELLELPRSTYYYCSQKPKDDQVEAAIIAVAGQYPCYGTRRVTHQLRRPPYEYQINRKRTQRIMRQNGLLRLVKRWKCHTTNSQHPYPRYRNLVADLEITRPDQVWVSDITYIRLGHSFVYLAVIMDLFTRAIRGWNLSKSLDIGLTLVALRKALQSRVPEIHHSDQGIHYAFKGYVDLLRKYGVQVSMAAQGDPRENGYAERLIRTIKEEEVDLSDYADFADAQAQIGWFIEDVYMTRRIHSALGYITPAEFERALWPAQTQPLEATP